MYNHEFSTYQAKERLEYTTPGEIAPSRFTETVQQIRSSMRSLFGKTKKILTTEYHIPGSKQVEKAIRNVFGTQEKLPMEEDQTSYEVHEKKATPSIFQKIENPHIFIRPACSSTEQQEEQGIAEHVQIVVTRVLDAHFTKKMFGKIHASQENTLVSFPTSAKTVTLPTTVNAIPVIQEVLQEIPLLRTSKAPTETLRASEVESNMLSRELLRQLASIEELPETMDKGTLHTYISNAIITYADTVLRPYILDQKKDIENIGKIYKDLSTKYIGPPLGEPGFYALFSFINAYNTLLPIPQAK